MLHGHLQVDQTASDKQERREAIVDDLMIFAPQSLLSLTFAPTKTHLDQGFMVVSRCEMAILSRPVWLQTQG